MSSMHSLPLIYSFFNVEPRNGAGAIKNVFIAYFRSSSPVSRKWS
jgi:hypothetical protein